MVESALDPRAVSWAGASGMWQFMVETGKRYGLRTRRGVDERNDPEKATLAAARHLNDLYEEFDDWHLALAAYNCGAGGVRGAIRRTTRKKKLGKDARLSYWDIYDELPDETRGYVPMFIATAVIFSNPTDFEIAQVPMGPSYSYDRLPTAPGIPLDTIAEAAGTDVATLLALNPEILGDTTPLVDPIYFVRLPTEALIGERATLLLPFMQAAWDTEDEPLRAQAEEGDTPTRLARVYGVDPEVFCATNTMARSAALTPGQNVLLPASASIKALPSSPASIHYGLRNDLLVELAIGADPLTESQLITVRELAQRTLAKRSGRIRRASVKAAAKKERRALRL